MADGRPSLLPADQWLSIDRWMWRRERNTLLCNDSAHPDDAQGILVSNSRPDSFTFAERLYSSPEWLAQSERDGDAWLRALVARRVRALPQFSEATERAAAALHVYDQMRRIVDMPDSTGNMAADTLWNQEIPYVVDRVAALSLTGDARAVLDPAPSMVIRSHWLANALLDWFAGRHRKFDIAALTRYALAAGLLDLGIKGGSAECRAIDTMGSPTGRAAELVAAADQPMIVDHLIPLLAAVARGPARLVWLTDDLIETAVDLLLIQRLTSLNPRLQVTIAPRSRRCDNDATTADVTRMLKHPTLDELAATVAAGRTSICRYGPCAAAPLLTKLHPELLRALSFADAVVVKGGRNHELLVGTLAQPMWTGYVVTREFTEAQAGYDARTAPLVFVHSVAEHRPWWGWRGRAHRRLAVADDRAITAAWSTVADHERRVSTTDPDLLYVDLAWMVNSWPLMREHYAQPARTEMQFVARRLANATRRTRDLDLIRRAQRLTDHKGDNNS